MHRQGEGAKQLLSSTRRAHDGAVGVRVQVGEEVTAGSSACGCIECHLVLLARLVVPHLQTRKPLTQRSSKLKSQQPKATSAPGSTAAASASAARHLQRPCPALLKVVTLWIACVHAFSRHRSRLCRYASAAQQQQRLLIQLSCIICRGPCCAGLLKHLRMARLRLVLRLC